eukprot:2868058-Amphidinium_carterae.1
MCSVLFLWKVKIALRENERNEVVDALRCDSGNFGLTPSDTQTPRNHASRLGLRPRKSNKETFPKGGFDNVLKSFFDGAAIWHGGASVDYAQAGRAVLDRPG